MPAIERLMARSVRTPRGCLEWQGARRGTMGYSSLGNDRGKLPKMIYGHVLSYEHHHGAIPSGMVVRHSCDNPLCVEPSHLLVGTPKDNHADMDASGNRHTRRFKLTQEDVREIREARAEDVSLSTLAERYGVSVSHISAISNGRRRKNV